MLSQSRWGIEIPPSTLQTPLLLWGCSSQSVSQSSKRTTTEWNNYKQRTPCKTPGRNVRSFRNRAEKHGKVVFLWQTRRGGTWPNSFGHHFASYQGEAPQPRWWLDKIAVTQETTRTNLESMASREQTGDRADARGQRHNREDNKQCTFHNNIRAFGCRNCGECKTKSKQING